MSLSRALGWGIVIYAIMYLVWNGFVLYGFVDGILPRAASLIVLIALSLIAGRSLKRHSAMDILPYSFIWVVIIALFDALYTVPYAGWGMYADWNLWVGYALVLLVPLTVPYFARTE